MTIYPAIAYAAQAFPQQLSAVFISSVWQGIMLVATTALCLHLLPQTRARFRFVIWSAVFVLLTALPIFNIFLVSHSHAAASAAPLQLDPRWSYALTALWFVAVAVRAVHFALEAIKLRALWTSAVPACGEIVADLAPMLGKVQICTSTQLDRPSLIGFFAPRILVPAWLFDQLTSSELHQIVLHELEHLRRRDDWLNLLQKLSLVVFPLNPALVWTDRRLATERELACDDGVLNLTRAPRAYATCLTSLAERGLAYRSGGRLTALALGAIGALRRSEFSDRIESILTSRPNVATAQPRASIAVAIVGLIGFAAGSSRAPQLVSFSASAPQQHAAVASSVQSASATYMEPTTSKPNAHFLNASFHLPPKADAPPSAKDSKRIAVHAVKAATRRSRNPLVIQTVKTAEPIPAPPMEGHWMVLTSWHETAPTPVLLTLPDGRTLFVTYPATPTQVEWLLVQL